MTTIRLEKKINKARQQTWVASADGRQISTWLEDIKAGELINEDHATRTLRTSTAAANALKKQLVAHLSQGFQPAAGTLHRAFDVLFEIDPAIHDASGDCLLHCAPNAAAAKKLVATMRDLRNDRKQTPLLTQASAGRASIVSLLIKAGADTGVRDHKQAGLLHHAARGGLIKLCRRLVAEGAKIKQIDAAGDSVLHYAAASGNAELVAWLCGLGLPVNAGGDDLPPLHIAVRRGDAKVVRVLLEHGAKPNLTTEFRSTALHIAAERCHWDQPVKIRKSYAAVARELLENGANASAKDRRGETPLDIAIHKEANEMISAIAEAGTVKVPLLAAVQTGMATLVRSALASTPKRQLKQAMAEAMAWCCADDDIGAGMLELLLGAGAPVDQRLPESDWTALHAAADSGNVLVVETLLKCGADPTIKCDGSTAADLAREVAELDDEEDFHEIVELLEKATRKKTAKKAAKKAPQKKTKGRSTTKRKAAANCQYFELSDGKSHKFWEITLSGAEHTVRYGRIGSSGASKTKAFPDQAAAAASASKLIRAKTAKGYRAAAR